MKVLGLLSLLFVLPIIGQNAHAFNGHGKFKVEMVKPWGEFGFRALGKGTDIKEMRFDCAQNSDVGFVVTVVNNYGKTSNIVLPGEKLGSDKFKCQAALKKYFENVHTERGLASLKDKTKHRTVDLNVVQGGLFSDEQSKTTLSFR